jgi:hypothetical protein
MTTSNGLPDSDQIPTGLKRQEQWIFSDSVWTKPKNKHWFYILAVGAGGGGGTTNGGGGGCWITATVISPLIPDHLVIEIGKGGTGAGGSTKFKWRNIDVLVLPGGAANGGTGTTVSTNLFAATIYHTINNSQTTNSASLFSAGGSTTSAGINGYADIPAGSVNQPGIQGYSFLTPALTCTGGSGTSGTGVGGTGGYGSGGGKCGTGTSLGGNGLVYIASW